MLAGSTWESGGLAPVGRDRLAAVDDNDLGLAVQLDVLPPAFGGLADPTSELALHRVPASRGRGAPPTRVVTSPA